MSLLDWIYYIILKKLSWEENELSCNPELDFDGNQEILIGTYGELVLVYKEDQNSGKWSLKWSKNFNNPVHNIFHLDLTGDGVKDLFLVTLKTVIILQHDYEKVAQIVEKRLETE